METNGGNYSNPLLDYFHNRDASVVGLGEASIPADVLFCFIWYARSEIFSYKLNRGVRLGMWQTYNASRGIATKIIANTLGLSNLIPETKYVRLFVSDKTQRFGSYMDIADGIPIEKYREYEKERVLTPEIQRSLNQLNILDAITYEKDHRVNNYHIEFKDNKAVRVCAFDNDSVLCFFINPSPAFSTYAGCSPLVVNGRYNRPYVDKEIVDKLKDIEFQQLRELLSGYCSLLQTIACYIRVIILRNSILKSMKKGSVRCLNREEWTEQTVKEELMSEKYGLTYLKLLETNIENKDNCDKK